jgi:group I intron endonuclease
MKKPYQLRLDEDMIETVKRLAIENDRSVNSEFRNLIRKSLQGFNIAGVYKITNEQGFFYIGQSKNVQKRLSQHLINSHCLNLNQSVKLYGIETHTFEILEECEVDNLIERENYYINNSDKKFILNQLKGEDSKTYLSEFDIEDEFINERNAGRKKVLNGKKIHLIVNAEKVKEIRAFAKSITTYETKKL